MNTAAGLGAFGFWIFIAAVVLGGIWYDVRRKESQQETLRRVVESGRELNAEVLDQIVGSGGSKSLERDLKVASYIVLAVAPGLAMLGLFLGQVDADARSALLGVSLLVGFIGAGLYLSARLVEQQYPNVRD